METAIGNWALLVVACSKPAPAPETPEPQEQVIGEKGVAIDNPELASPTEAAAKPARTALKDRLLKDGATYVFDLERSPKAHGEAKSACRSAAADPAATVTYDACMKAQVERAARHGFRFVARAQDDNALQIFEPGPDGQERVAIEAQVQWQPSPGTQVRFKLQGPLGGAIGPALEPTQVAELTAGETTYEGGAGGVLEELRPDGGKMVYRKR
jgi:hypothetical protein